jgi:hypothetical protein
MLYVGIVAARCPRGRIGANPCIGPRPKSIGVLESGCRNHRPRAAENRKPSTTSPLLTSCFAGSGNGWVPGRNVIRAAVERKSTLHDLPIDYHRSLSCRLRRAPRPPPSQVRAPDLVNVHRWIVVRRSSSSGFQCSLTVCLRRRRRKGANLNLRLF